MDMFDAMVVGFVALLTPQALLFITIGVVYGLVIGILPGLGGIVAMTLLLPFAVGFQPAAFLGMLLGAHNLLGLIAKGRKQKGRQQKEHKPCQIIQQKKQKRYPATGGHGKACRLKKHSAFPNGLAGKTGAYYSTSRMISSFSDAGYLMPLRPHPQSCFF